MIRKRLSAIVVAAVAVIVVGGATALPASATSGQGRNSTGLTVTTSQRAAAKVPATCVDNSGNLCFWNNAGFTDGPGLLSGTNPDWTEFKHSSCPRGTWNDCVTSLYNAGVHCSAVVWTAASYHEWGLVVVRDDWYDDLSTEAPTWQDSISSNSWSQCD